MKHGSTWAQHKCTALTQGKAKKPPSKLWMMGSGAKPIGMYRTRLHRTDHCPAHRMIDSCESGQVHRETLEELECFREPLGQMQSEIWRWPRQPFTTGATL